MWILYALGSAIFAALTSITAKVGITGVDSNLGTAIRTLVVLIIATGIVLFSGAFKELPSISTKSWAFLVISGIMTGLSWLCFYKAIQIGDVSKVASVDKFSIVLVIVFSALFLKEVVNFKVVLACLLITVGTILMIF
ncbi:MAG: EamA family transporter [Candidatus Gastranaerophilaceae bacterium]